MFSMFFVVFSLGYGIGYEGYSDEKLYFGVYTPQAEYGWVVSNREIYLDTIFEKNNDWALDKPISLV
jgi:hypothetical protein